MWKCCCISPTCFCFSNPVPREVTHNSSVIIHRAGNMYYVNQCQNLEGHLRLSFWQADSSGHLILGRALPLPAACTSTRTSRGCTCNNSKVISSRPCPTYAHPSVWQEFYSKYKRKQYSSGFFFKHFSLPLWATIFSICFPFTNHYLTWTHRCVFLNC